jgi:hypothetical protein
MDEVKINKRIENIEERLLIFIDHKFNCLTESIIEKMINRRFEEEIERRVTKRLQERGKF